MNIKMLYHIYEIRRKKKMSTDRLAKLSGVGKTTINDIENYRHDPTVKTLCMLAEALETVPESLYSYRIE